MQQAPALTDATTPAAALHAQAEAGRTGSDEGAAVGVVEDALAPCAALVDAVPALAERHQTWVARFADTAGRDEGRRALAAANHLALLTNAGRRPVVVADPGRRFAGDLDEVVITRR